MNQTYKRLSFPKSSSWISLSFAIWSVNVTFLILPVRSETVYFVQGQHTGLCQVYYAPKHNAVEYEEPPEGTDPMSSC